VLLALLQHNNDDTARYRLDGTDGKEQPVKADLHGLSWGEAYAALANMHKKRFGFTIFNCKIDGIEIPIDAGA